MAALQYRGGCIKLRNPGSSALSRSSCVVWSWGMPTIHFRAIGAPILGGSSSVASFIPRWPAIEHTIGPVCHFIAQNTKQASTEQISDVLCFKVFLLGVFIPCLFSTFSASSLQIYHHRTRFTKIPLEFIYLNSYLFYSYSA